MGAVITLLIINLIVLVIGLIIMSNLTKIRREKWIESMIGRISLENINVTDCFSKEVLNFYLDVLKDTNKFEVTAHTLNKVGSEIQVWISNDVDSRRWYTHDVDSKEKVEELNKKLTIYDKMLLDRITNAIRERHDKLVTKFFL
jgi:hypothetical protein